MNKSIRLFFKQMSLYTSASIDMLQAFDLACKRVKDKKLLILLTLVLSDLQSGKAFSDSINILLANKYIDSICFSVISTAERTGNLEQAFGTVFEYMENNAKDKGEIISSLSYPIMIMCTAFALVAVLVVNIFPKIIPLFTSMHIKIPLLTQFIVSISYFIINNKFWIIGVVSIIFSISIFAYRLSSSFKIRLQNIALKVPFFGSIFVLKELRRVAYSYSLLLNADISIIECIKLVNVNCKWIPIKNIFDELILNTDSGKKVSDTFSKYSFFEGEWNDLVLVGEATGSLPKTFLDLSMIQASLLKERINNISKWSEPIALMFVASVTLVVALSVVQPMYAIIQNVNQ